MIKAWQTVASDIAFENRWYKLRRDTVRLPPGRIVDDYFVSVRPDVALVFATTPAAEVICVRQYKHGIGRVVIELPGGTLGSEAPAQGAQRELLEETGYRCGPLRALGSLVDDPTKNTNRVHVFHGADAVRVAEQSLDDNERDSGVEVLLLRAPDLLAKVRSGEIQGQSTVAALYLALDHLGWVVAPHTP